MERKATEGTWTARPITGSTRQNMVVGLDAVTVEPQSHTPYFFLMCDIDTKEQETLRTIIQFYAQNQLSVYFWETKKGYHTLSPALLKLRVWTRLTCDLRDKIQYDFDTLRWSARYTDSSILYFEDYHTRRFQESLTMHQAIANKFCTIPVNRGIETVLTWSMYSQLEFKQKLFKEKFRSL